MCNSRINVARIITAGIIRRTMSGDTSTSDCGAIYLAFGYEYLVMSIRSAISLRKQNPDLPITVVTNLPVNENFDDHIPNFGCSNQNALINNFIVVDDDSEENRDYKTSIIDYSPYNKSLFLDCDTFIQKNIRSGFRFLQYSDLALVSRPIPSRSMVDKWEGDIDLEEIPIDDISTFYSGVFFFDKKETEDFFKKWNRGYHQSGSKYDQFSLISAIYQSDIKILPLPVTWNTMSSDVSRYRFFDIGYKFTNNIKILHQNHHSISRNRDLRQLEEKIGAHILDMEQRDIQNHREKFGEKINTINAVKGELTKNRVTHSIYARINSIVGN